MSYSKKVYLTPPIDAFPTDDRVWRIDWLGGIKKPLYDENNESTIEVIISPVLNEDISWFNQWNIEKKEAKKIELTIGFLPILSIGSFWQNQKLLQGKVSSSRKAFHRLKVNDSTTVEVIQNESANEPNIKKAKLIPVQKHAIGAKKGLGTSFNSRCICIEHNGDPYGIIIPTIEVIRFYWLTSTNLVYAIFGNGYEKLRNKIIDPGLTFQNEVTNTLYMKIRKGFPTTDKYSIGRIVTDPKSQKAINKFAKSWNVQGLKNSVIYPSTLYPIDGETNLIVEGIEISENPKRYLVFKILKCTGKFNFNSIADTRDYFRGDSTSGSQNDTDGPILSNIPHIRNTVKKDKTTISIQEKGHADFINDFITDPEERFSESRHIKIEPPKVKPSNSSLFDRKPPELINTNLSAIGVNQQRDRYISNIKIQSEINKKLDLPDVFSCFNELINHINSETDVTAVLRYEDVEREVPLKEKGIRDAQWGYLYSPTRRHRKIYLGDINYNDLYFLIMEFDRRKNEHFSIPVFFYLEGIKISEDQVSSISQKILDTEGRWKKFDDFDEFFLDTVKHSTLGPSQTAKLIVQKIIRISNLYQNYFI